MVLLNKGGDVKIQCYKCGKNLGEIRDATLRKHIYHVCYHCAANDEKPKKPSYDIPDFLKGIFR